MVTSFHLNNTKSYALRAAIILISELNLYEIRKVNFPKIMHNGALNMVGTRYSCS